MLPMVESLPCELMPTSQGIARSTYTEADQTAPSISPNHRRTALNKSLSILNNVALRSGGIWCEKRSFVRMSVCVFVHQAEDSLHIVDV